MTIRRTLTSMVLAGVLALGGAGCSNNSQSNSQQSNWTAQGYLQSAEDRIIVHRMNADYNMAQYSLLVEIVENNNALLRERGISVAVSEHVDGATEYAQSAESRINIHMVNLDYNRAQYQLNQAILVQQEVLLRERGNSVGISEYVNRATACARSVESRISVHQMNVDYNRAQYLQLRAIIENNNVLLRERGNSVDISEYVNRATACARSAESRIIVHQMNVDYNRAQYQLNQAILVQQEVLK